MKRLDQPSIIPIADGGAALYVLERDYRYEWMAKEQHWRITVPAGFQTDGASVPWIGTVLTGITRDGLHRAAALIHDYLYQYGGRLPSGSFARFYPASQVSYSQTTPWSREQADKLFAIMLRQAGVVRWRRRLMYLAVRAVGWRFWKSQPK